jgi:ACS family hexuronate transporter-like MFS transporter
VPSRSATPIVPRAWLVLLLAGFAGMLFYVDRQTLSVLKTTLQQEWSWTDADYGAMVGAFMIPYTLFYLVTGRWIDRWGTRRMMPLFLGTMSLATLGSGISSSSLQLGFWRAVLGAAEAGIIPSVMVAIIQWFPPDRRGTAATINKPLTVAGQILVVPLAAWIALHLGWRWAFLLPGILGFGCAVAWWWADRGAPLPMPPGEVPQYHSVLARREIRGVLIARLVSDPLWFFLIFWQPALLQEQLSLSLGELGRVGWIPTTLALGGIMALGFASDRLVLRGFAPARARLSVLLGSTIAAPAVFILPHVHSLPLALGLLAVIQIMTASWMSLSGLLIGDLMPARMVGTAVALMSAIGAATGALFNLAAGSLVSAFGYPFLLTACAFLHPLAAAILWLSYRDLDGVSAERATGRENA